MGQSSLADLRALVETSPHRARARVICRASRPSIATGCGLVLNYVECEKTHSSQDPHEHMLEGEEVLKHKAPYIQIPSLRLSTATSC